MDSNEAGAVGYAPVVAVGVSEQAKYEAMWQHEQYRAVAPGESIAMQFLSQAQLKPGSEVIDFGTGTGRGALMIALLGQARVHMLDFAGNCLDPEVNQALTTQAHALSFTQHDLNKPVPLQAAYGYCTDVMEHIPPDEVDRVLTNILRAAQHVFFQISCEDDVCGALIGQPLHLSVHPYAWWLSKLQSMDCVIHWSADFASHCCFYVTAWQSGTDFIDKGVLNTDESVLIDNVRQNIAGAWQTVRPYEANDTEVMILCGGPSLNDFEDEIFANKAAGIKLVTTNGTYQWALDRNLTPLNQIVVDGREFNARFTHPVQDNCLYFIASQVDPLVLQGLPLDRTYLWHTNVGKIKDLLDDRYETWFNTPGGSTVTLRAIPLLRMLGFKRFHLYGFDSCLRDEAHHAYEQPENNDAMVIPVTCGGRLFHCHPWMVSQAQEFQDLIKFMGDEIEVEVHGDGLIAHILQTGAAMAAADEELAA